LLAAFGRRSFPKDDDDEDDRDHDDDGNGDKRQRRRRRQATATATPSTFTTGIAGIFVCGGEGGGGGRRPPDAFDGGDVVGAGRGTAVGGRSGLRP
jgi:hypothetical protein